MQVRGARLSAAKAQPAEFLRILDVNRRDKPGVKQVLLQLGLLFQTEVTIMATTQGQKVPYLLGRRLLD